MFLGESAEIHHVSWVKFLDHLLPNATPRPWNWWPSCPEAARRVEAQAWNAGTRKTLAGDIRKKKNWMENLQITIKYWINHSKLGLK